MRIWQSRPLDAVYPILYFDCLFVKIPPRGRGENKGGLRGVGHDAPGVSNTEGAKFGLAVFTELQSRGVRDCFVACADGLKALQEALETNLSAHAGSTLCGV